MYCARAVREHRRRSPSAAQTVAIVRTSIAAVHMPHGVDLGVFGELVAVVVVDQRVLDACGRCGDGPR